MEKENKTHYSAIKVLQFGLDMKLVKKHKDLTKAADDIGVNPEELYKYCRSPKCSFKGYYWMAY